MGNIDLSKVWQWNSYLMISLSRLPFHALWKANSKKGSWPFLLTDYVIRHCSCIKHFQFVTTFDGRPTIFLSYLYIFIVVVDARFWIIPLMQNISFSTEYWPKKRRSLQKLLLSDLRYNLQVVMLILITWLWRYKLTACKNDRNVCLWSKACIWHSVLSNYIIQYYLTNLIRSSSVGLEHDGWCSVFYFCHFSRNVRLVMAIRSVSFKKNGVKDAKKPAFLLVQIICSHFHV